MLVARRASCHVANAFSTRLNLIWLRFSLETTKMSKNAVLAKSSRSQWVNDCIKCERDSPTIFFVTTESNNHWTTTYTTVNCTIQSIEKDGMLLLDLMLDIENVLTQLIFTQYPRTSFKVAPYSFNRIYT